MMRMVVSILILFFISCGSPPHKENDHVYLNKQEKIRLMKLELDSSSKAFEAVILSLLQLKDLKELKDGHFIQCWYEESPRGEVELLQLTDSAGQWTAVTASFRYGKENESEQPVLRRQKVLKNIKPRNGWNLMKDSLRILDVEHLHDYTKDEGFISGQVSDGPFVYFEMRNGKEYRRFYCPSPFISYPFSEKVDNVLNLFKREFGLRIPYREKIKN